MERDFCNFNLCIRGIFLIKKGISPYKINRKYSSYKQILSCLNLFEGKCCFEFTLGKEIQRHISGGELGKGSEPFSHDKSYVCIRASVTYLEGGGGKPRLQMGTCEKQHMGDVGQR